MVILEPTRLHWIKDDGQDDPCDLCAHSPVRFEVNGEVLVGPDEPDGRWSASAAAIYLLRTLETDRALRPIDRPEHDEDPLIPCCGHSMWDFGEPNVRFMGCGLGHDFGTARNGQFIRLNRYDGWFFDVTIDTWRQAVFSFSSRVRAFYDSSLPKRVSDDMEERKGYALFLAEWERRHPR